jgi:hypothetical protein
MTISILNTKNNYIILTNNIINTSNVGSLLHIKTNISDLSNNATDISWQAILQTLTNNSNNNNSYSNNSYSNNNTYKNRILVSGKINNTGNNTSTNCCLITQNNIKNNMKFLFDSSNNKNGKLLFVKNLNTNDNSYNYLFDDLSYTLFEKSDTLFEKKNINNVLTTTIDTTYNRFRCHLNYYFSNSDIYQINIRDYLYLNYTQFSQTLSYNDISYAITGISNKFSYINATIDSYTNINFKESNFNTLVIDNSSNKNFTILQENTYYSINRNILSYNKLTLDYKHVNYYDFIVKSTYNLYSSYNINTIKTFLIRTNNLSIIQNIKKNSKIIFGSIGSSPITSIIYLNNVKVLDCNSTLYTRDISFNNQNKRLSGDFSNIIFLGLGNRLTGITQHDLYNHIHFSIYPENKYIITFKKNINRNIITSKFSSLIPTSLIPNLTNYYLLDISLNYAKISNSHNINNTINYNNVLTNNLVSQVGKIFNLSSIPSLPIIDPATNHFKSSFSNLAKINNVPDNIYSISFESVEQSMSVRLKDIIRDPSDTNLVNITQLEGINIPATSDFGYDLRFNYSKTFYIFNNLDIYLNSRSSFLNLTNSSYAFDIINFYTLTVANLVITSRVSDFANVDCIYIYHDPINDPDPQFRYPNNNIEIKRDSEIDTLSKAIEQYRGSGARTSTTNAAFVPAQNGSNLSRKMIQGIIGLNNIPKLLSIEPYDPNFINGRGFINQYQIDDVCISTNCEKVDVKQNAIKHESVKNNRIYSSNSLKKQNFANIVKSNSRNRLSQECINNNTTTRNVVSINNSTINADCTNIKKTPFFLFTKGKGKYLGA